MPAIVIMGGFLAPGWLYTDLEAALAGLSGRPVFTVDTAGPEWLAAVAPPGWVPLLEKLHRTVRRAAAAGGPVTLVAHSAGGVLARLYLGPRPVFGRTYDGRRHVRQLITLGSPHHTSGRLIYGGALARWAERRYPGAFFAPGVAYLAVAGRWRPGDRAGAPEDRWRYRVYRGQCGDGLAWGDGLVPVQSALLRGAGHLVLDGVSHQGLFGEPWYGSPEAAARWWPAAEAQLAAAGAGENDHP